MKILDLLTTQFMNKVKHWVVEKEEINDCINQSL